MLLSNHIYSCGCSNVTPLGPGHSGLVYVLPKSCSALVHVYSCLISIAMLAVCSSMLNCHVHGVQAMAIKRVKDTYMRLGQWNLVSFLKEVGCTPEVDSAPVTQAEFDRVKDNGLRALHPANQQGLATL